LLCNIYQARLFMSNKVIESVFMNFNFSHVTIIKLNLLKIYEFAFYRNIYLYIIRKDDKAWT